MNNVDNDVIKIDFITYSTGFWARAWSIIIAAIIGGAAAFITTPKNEL